MRLTFVLWSLFLSAVIVVIVGAWFVRAHTIIRLISERRKKRQEYLASHPCHECAFDESIWGVCSECHRTGGGDKDLWEEIQ